jgi:carbon monoxide dehydrogenase subunit G
VKIENAFEVEAPPESAWDLLMDVPRVIPCMPGAELTETIDESTWKAHLKVKLGPISLNFEADVTREESDKAAGRVRLAAQARELKGRGAALATIESTLAAFNGGTRVDIVTDVGMSGAIAQYGRGMIQDVSTQLVSSFADCLQKQLTAAPEKAQAAVAAQSKPVGGLRLGLGALRRALGRIFRRKERSDS